MGRVYTVLPPWGRRHEAPVGGNIRRSITPPSVGFADISPMGGGAVR
jgi:hypothetical protein